jgi:Xaa-Pro aminopeptidase
MFQSFIAKTQPQDGPPRLAALRKALAVQQVDGFLVPRADRFQGEYVADCDERLAWLTGFTGSAGFAAILPDIAGVFVDGRYRLQARAQCDQTAFTPVDWPETGLADWLQDHLPGGGVIGFDPWLHTVHEIETLTQKLAQTGITIRAISNPIDTIWPNRPAPPQGAAVQWPVAYAGCRAVEKLAQCGADLQRAGHACAVITQPDSLCWALNLRGSDVAHMPIVQMMGILHQDGRLDIFADRAKFIGIDLPVGVSLQPENHLSPALQNLHGGPVRLDPQTAPYAVKTLLEHADCAICTGSDPCLLPKACKNHAEIAATTQAHLRDGAAVAKFLHWFDTNAPKGGLTEIDCAKRLEAFRGETGDLKDISFDTIAGAGPNGAIVHYRVTENTNAPVLPGQLFLIDSGGQYEDGTTDITRTLAVGDVGVDEKTAFTQVLKGMIAIHLARFPKGVAGAHLDALARAPLWAAGRDYDHGTGHGVGVYLGVHEGPQRLSRASGTPLQPGMIVSNEPGYYRAGAFGIRIENLVYVTKAANLPGGDDRDMFEFQTLTYAPIDRRLIMVDLLSAPERDWINTYHGDVLAKIKPLVPGDVRAWLDQACAPI